MALRWAFIFPQFSCHKHSSSWIHIAALPLLASTIFVSFSALLWKYNCYLFNDLLCFFSPVNNWKYVRSIELCILIRWIFNWLLMNSSNRFSVGLICDGKLVRWQWTIKTLCWTTTKLCITSKRWRWWRWSFEARLGNNVKWPKIHIECNTLVVFCYKWY